MKLAIYHIREFSRSYVLSSSACHHSRSRELLRRCLHAGARTPLRKGHVRPFSQSSSWLQQKSTYDPKTQQNFAKDVDSIDAIEPVKPETVKRLGAATVIQAPNTDGLLSEQTVSNKEQRKADWAIMKEMVQYLWPKVGQGAWKPRHLVSDAAEGRYGNQSQGWYGTGVVGWLKGLLSFSRPLYIHAQDSPGAQHPSPILL